jgi:hypothetical protein
VFAIAFIVTHLLVRLWGDAFCDEPDADKELIEAGKLTPVISAQYLLSETSKAVRHFEEGHPRGKVVITV